MLKRQMLKMLQTRKMRVRHGTGNLHPGRDSGLTGVLGCLNNATATNRSRPCGFFKRRSQAFIRRDILVALNSLKVTRHPRSGWARVTAYVAANSSGLLPIQPPLSLYVLRPLARERGDPSRPNLSEQLRLRGCAKGAAADDADKQPAFLARGKLPVPVPSAPGKKSSSERFLRGGGAGGGS